MNIEYMENDRCMDIYTHTQSHAPFVPDEDVARFLELSVFFDLACTANAGWSVLNQIGCGE